jgi:cell division protein FtsW (lipid II flippase)
MSAITSRPRVHGQGDGVPDRAVNRAAIISGVIALAGVGLVASFTSGLVSERADDVAGPAALLAAPGSFVAALVALRSRASRARRYTSVAWIVLSLAILALVAVLLLVVAFASGGGMAPSDGNNLL